MQYNIFQNDFYDDLPGVPWAFRVTVMLGDPPIAVEMLEKSVKDVKIPDMELKTHEAFFGGKKFIIPTRYTNSGTLNITFNDDKNLSVYNTILKIFRRTYDNRDEIQVTEDGTVYQPKYSDMTKPLSLVVEILDPSMLSKIDTQLNHFGELETNDPEVVAVYTFGDCFFETIDEVEFDYSSEECVEWSIPVIYNSIDTDYPGKSEVKIFDRSDRSSSDLYIPANSSTNGKWDPIPKRAATEKLYYGTAGSGNGRGHGSGDGYGGSGALYGNDGDGIAYDSTVDTIPSSGIKSLEPAKNDAIDYPNGRTDVESENNLLGNRNVLDSAENNLDMTDSKYDSKAKDMFGDEYINASKAERAEMRGFARDADTREREDEAIEKKIRSEYENLDDTAIEMLKFRERNPGIDTLEGATEYKRKHIGSNGIDMDPVAKRQYDEYFKWRNTVGTDL